MCILKTLHVSFKMPVHQNKLPSVPCLNKRSEVPVLRSTIPSRCCRRPSGRCFERVCAVTSPSSQDFANIFSLSHQSLIVQEDANRHTWQTGRGHETTGLNIPRSSFHEGAEGLLIACSPTSETSRGTVITHSYDPGREAWAQSRHNSSLS